MSSVSLNSNTDITSSHLWKPKEKQNKNATEMKEITPKNWLNNILDNLRDPADETEECTSSLFSNTSSRASSSSCVEEKTPQKKEGLAELQKTIIDEFAEIAKKNIVNELMCQDILKAMNDIQQFIASQYLERKLEQIDEIYISLYTRLYIQFELQNQKKSHEAMTVFIKTLLVCIFIISIEEITINKKRMKHDCSSPSNSHLAIKKILEKQDNSECLLCSGFPSLIPSISQFSIHFFMKEFKNVNENFSEIINHVLNFEFNFLEKEKEKISNLQNNQEEIISSYFENKLRLMIIKNSKGITCIGFIDKKNELINGNLKVIPGNTNINLKSYIYYHSEDEKLKANKPRLFEYTNGVTVFVQILKIEQKFKYYSLKITNPNIDLENKHQDIKEKILEIELQFKVDTKKQDLMKSILLLLETCSFCSNELFHLKIQLLNNSQIQLEEPVEIEKLTVLFNSKSSYSSFSFDSNGDVFAKTENGIKISNLKDVFSNFHKLDVMHAFLNYIVFNNSNSFSITLPNEAPTDISIPYKKIVLEVDSLEKALLDYVIYYHRNTEDNPSIGQIKFFFWLYQSNPLLGNLKSYSHYALKHLTLQDRPLHHINGAEIFFNPLNDKNLLYGGPKSLQLKPNSSMSILQFHDNYKIPFFLHDKHLKINLTGVKNIQQGLQEFEVISRRNFLVPFEILKTNFDEKFAKKSARQIIFPSNENIAYICQSPKIHYCFYDKNYTFIHVLDTSDKYGYPIPNTQIKIIVHSIYKRKKVREIIVFLKSITDAPSSLSKAIEFKPLYSSNVEIRNSMDSRIVLNEFLVSYDKEIKRYICRGHPDFKII